MQIPVYSLKGEVIDKIELREDVFGILFNEGVVHQALVRQLANRRQGTADTKTRGEVSGSGRKAFAQKHTGRARRGGSRSPLLRGGGVVFGPHPRSYRQAMPKKMRRLASRCVFSAKAREGELKVVDKLELQEMKTRRMAEILSALEVYTSVLIATAGVEPIVVKSARNLPGVKILPAALLNIGDLLSYRILIMTVAAVREVERIWGQRQAQEMVAIP